MARANQMATDIEKVINNRMNIWKSLRLQCRYLDD